MRFIQLISADIVVVDSSATFWIIFLLALLILVVSTPQEDRLPAIRRCLLGMFVVSVLIGLGFGAYYAWEATEQREAEAETQRRAEAVVELAERNKAEAAAQKAHAAARRAAELAARPELERQRKLREVEEKYGAK